MTGTNFANVMTHFVKHSASSKDNQSLLILDNHESHLETKALDIAKENGVTMVTLPPHTSHRFQPLDVSCYGPFKTYYAGALKSVLFRKHTAITIYNVVECVNIVHERGLTPSNIKSGFRKTGIFPFDRHIFCDDDFAPSQISDRRPPEGTETSTNLELPGETNNAASEQAPNIDKIVTSSPMLDNAETSASSLINGVQSRSNQNDTAEAVATSSAVELVVETPTVDRHMPKSIFPQFSPVDLRPYPKAEERKRKGGRKKGKSIIATDTPVKNELQERKKITKKIRLSVRYPMCLEFTTLIMKLVNYHLCSQLRYSS